MPGRLKPTRLASFLLVGATNTLVGYGVFAGMLALGFHHVYGSMTTMLLSICLGYLGQGKIVFKSLTRSGLLRYVLMWLGLLGLYSGIVESTVAAGFSAYIGGILAAPPVIAVSYLAQRYFVFSDSGRFGAAMERDSEHSK
jgi:putative flippase GtrA